MFTPSTEKRERLIKVLFSIFLRTEVKLDVLNYISKLGKEDCPTFADKLKLRLPESVYRSIATEAKEFDAGKLSKLHGTSSRPSDVFFKSLIDGIKKPEVWFNSVTDFGGQNWDWKGESAKLQMYMYRIDPTNEWSECTIGNVSGTPELALLNNLKLTLDIAVLRVESLARTGHSSKTQQGTEIIMVHYGIYSLIPMTRLSVEQSC